MTVKELGESIKIRRKSLKITQPDLSELAGISPNTLYKLECGLTNPSMDVVSKVADILGLELTLIPKVKSMQESINESNEDLVSRS
ncbi:MAG: helix-turn-helix domain-containing protein [Chloroherpetonaceae bacterium]|nr:helix-turn-helix domain-containing protein [Chloroherpetonaceae bacterium]